MGSNSLFIFETNHRNILTQHIFTSFFPVLAEQTQWIPLLITLVVHGFFRGLCLINFPLVISEYVPVDKFAAAYGLSMVSKGVFIVVLGPISGE